MQIQNAYLTHNRPRTIRKQTTAIAVHWVANPGSSAMANMGLYSEAHQPMLRSMSAILLREGVKELYFRDFLQSCVWVDEKETGIFACMKRFNAHIRPLVLDGVQEERIPQWDLRVYRAVVKGWFPQLYVLLRVREKLTKKKWGIRR